MRPNQNQSAIQANSHYNQSSNTDSSDEMIKSEIEKKFPFNPIAITRLDETRFIVLTQNDRLIFSFKIINFNTSEIITTWDSSSSYSFEFFMITTDDEKLIINSVYGVEIWDIATQQLINVVSIGEQNLSGIFALSNQRFCLLSSDGGHHYFVLIYDTSGNCIKVTFLNNYSYDPNNLQMIAYDKNDFLTLSGSDSNGKSFIQVFDCQSYNLWVYAVTPWFDSVCTTFYWKDDLVITVTAGEARICIWNIKTCETSHVINIQSLSTSYNSAYVTSAMFYKDNKIICTINNPTAILVIDIEKAALIVSYTYNSYIYCSFLNNFLAIVINNVDYNNHEIIVVNTEKEENIKIIQLDPSLSIINLFAVDKQLTVIATKPNSYPANMELFKYNLPPLELKNTNNNHAPANSLLDSITAHTNKLKNAFFVGNKANILSQLTQMDNASDIQKIINENKKELGRHRNILKRLLAKLLPQSIFAIFFAKAKSLQLAEQLLSEAMQKTKQTISLQTQHINAGTAINVKNSYTTISSFTKPVMTMPAGFQPNPQNTDVYYVNPINKSGRNAPTNNEAFRDKFMTPVITIPAGYQPPPSYVK